MPTTEAASVVAALFVDELDCDGQGVAIPRPEVHLVARFGPSAHGGLDVHAFGGRQKVHRKLLRGGQRAVTVRLHLGAAAAVLGVPASAIAGQTVALEDLWGDAAARRLADRLAGAGDTVAAARVLEAAIAGRGADAGRHGDRTRLVLDAADRLTRAPVSAVAVDLGMSERHLLRVFREAIGVGPKRFATLMRFHRAVQAARRDAGASWASIAADAGYYDQAHLIAEFRAVAGVTPQMLLGELRATQSIG